MCLFFHIILDIKLVGRTSRGHTGGRSHRIFHPPSFCGECLNFSRENDCSHSFSSSTVKSNLCTNDLIVLHLLGIFFFFFFLVRKNSRLPRFELMSQRVRSYEFTSELPGRARLLSNVPKGYRQFAASLITSHVRASCPHRMFAASLLQTFPHGSHARGE